MSLCSGTFETPCKDYAAVVDIHAADISLRM
jgi:hypothetical protein